MNNLVEKQPLKPKRGSILVLILEYTCEEGFLRIKKL